MQQARWTIALLVATLFAAACTDAGTTPPLSPTGPASSAAVCPDAEADAIQGVIATLFRPEGGFDAASAQFTNVRRADCRNNEADARAKGIALVEFAITRYNNGQLLDPAGPTTTAGALYDFISRLYAYLGLSDFAAIPQVEFERAAWDGAVGFARPGVPFTIRAVSGDFASTTDAAFFTKPAVVVLARVPGPVPFQTTYTEYPPRYHVTVSPQDAQANYGVPTTASSPRAYSAICVGGAPQYANEPTPAQRAGMKILRVPSPGDELARPMELLPRSSVALPLLNCSAKDDAPPPVFGALPAPGNDRYFAVGRRAAGRLGGMLASFLTPRNLYAWDGGMGGQNFEYSGFVAADTTPIAPAPATGVVAVSGFLSTINNASAAGYTVCVPNPHVFTAVVSYCGTANTDGFYSFDIPANSGMQGGTGSFTARTPAGAIAATRTATIPTSGSLTLDFNELP